MAWWKNSKGGRLGGLPSESTRPGRAIALEPRVLLDAAALETGAEVVGQATPDAVDLQESVGGDRLAAALDAAFAPAFEDQQREVVFIDGSVDDRDALLADISLGTPVFILDPSRDGLAQISETLTAFRDLDAVHVISHGERGSVQLGDLSLNADNLSDHAGSLEAFRDSMKSGGDLLFYGCDLAAGAEGEAFVDRLSSLTGADVAASSDRTANGALGGDWDLEYNSGSVGTEALYAGTVEGFRQALPIGWVDMGSWGDGDVASAQQGMKVAADDQWVAVAGTTDKVFVSRPVAGDEYTITLPTAEGTGEGGVAIDISGDYLVAGDSQNGGSVYLYKYNSGTDAWERQVSFDQDSELEPVANANFGWDVAIDTTGSTFYMAATALEAGTSGEGGVWAWSSTDGVNWNPAGNVSETPGDGDDQFGHAIDIAGGKLYVTAPEYDDAFESCGRLGIICSNDDTNKGRLYSFDFSGTSLLSAATIVKTGGTDANVGQSVDADHDGTDLWVAVGGRGDDRVWVFRNGGQVNTIDGNRDFNYDAADQFGFSVAMDGQRLLVGAPYGHGDDGWAFRFDDATTTTISETYGGSDSATEQDGYSVALARDIVVVGAPNYDASADIEDSGRGHVWFYNRAPNGNLSGSTGENSDFTLDVVNARDYGNDGVMDPLSLKSSSVSDPGGGAGGSVSIIGGELTWSPGTDYDYLAETESATVTVSFSLADSFGDEDTNLLIITVNGQEDAIYVADPTPGQIDNVGTANTLPTPFLEPDVSERSDIIYEATAEAVDQDGNPISGPTLTVSVDPATGEVSYTPAAEHFGYRYRITLTGTSNGVTATDVFLTDIERANDAPQADSSPGTLTAYEDNVQEGSFVGGSYDMTQHFSDSDSEDDPTPGSPGDNLEYSITSGQSWLSVDPTTGALNATALNSHVGPHSVTVQVTDEYGLTGEVTFTVNVINSNDAPVVATPVPEQEAYLDQTYSFTFNVYDYFDDLDPSGDTVTLTAAFNDGTGRTLDTADPGAGDGQWLRFRSLGGGDYQFYSDDNADPADTPQGPVAGDPLGTVLPIRLIADDNTGTANATTAEDFDISVFPSPGDGNFVAVPANNTQSGWDVSISENGQWMAVGQPRWSDDFRGNVRIFEWTGSWTSRGFLYTDSGGGTEPRTAGDRFGYAVDFDADGLRLLVGAPGDDGDLGRVYAFTNDGAGNFTQNASYVAGDRNAGDKFGASVALNQNGSQFVVGAWGDDAAGTDAGAAYLFNWGTGTQQDKLTSALDAGDIDAAYDRFGHDVDFDRSVAVIGAPLDTHNGEFFAGSATAVTVNENGFGATQKLTRGVNSASQDFYGWSVGIDVFQGEGTGSVDDSAVIAVGAIQDDTLARNHGAVYTYRSDSLTYRPADLSSLSHMATVTAYDGKADQSYGISVSVDAGGVGDDEAAGGLRLVAGADVNASAEGAAYAYRWWGANGWLGKKYEQANGTFNTTPAENQFGWAVDISGTRLIVGAPNTNEGAEEPRGAVYWGDTAGTEIEQGLNSGSVAKSLASGDVTGSSGGTSGEPLAFRSLLALQEDEEERDGRLRDQDRPGAGTFKTGPDADTLFAPSTSGDGTGTEASSAAMLFEERTLNRLDANSATESGDPRGAETDCGEEACAPEQRDGEGSKSGSESFSDQLREAQRQKQLSRFSLSDSLQRLVS